MSDGRTNWAILVATCTFPVAAVALVLALRPGDPPKPPAPPRVGQPPPPGAGPGFHPPPPWHGMGAPRGALPAHWRARLGERIQALAKVLELEEGQRKQVQTLADQANDRLAEIALAEHKVRRSLRRLLAGPKATEAQITELLGSLAKLEGEAERLRVLTPWRLRNLLTEKQRKKLGAGQWNRRGPRGPGFRGPGGPGFRGRGGPMGPPPHHGPPPGGPPPHPHPGPMGFRR